jgi:Ca2+-binding RTX toxin-like protein
MADQYHIIPAGQAGDTSSTGVANTQNPTSVTNNALGFLEVFEGLKPPQFSTITPYPDKKGLPTVGIGWLLRDSAGGVAFNAAAYLNEIGVPQTDPRFQAMDAVFNKIWLTSSGQPDYSGLTAALNTAYGGTVPTLTTSQVSDLWNQIVLSNSNQGQYNKFLTTLTNSGVNIDTTNLLNSKEGVALFTMSYNGAMHSTDSLLKDLSVDNFNRADAWFQIRYDTNKGQTDSVATRQYAASEVFGLYAPGDTDSNVSNDEAFAIYAELSKQFGAQTGRAEAFAYEAKFSGDVAKANDSLSAGYITNDSPALVGTTVQKLEDELQPAANTINALLNDKLANPYYTGTAAFNSLDIQVAVLQGGSNLVATARNGYQLVSGAYSSANSAVLIAQGGNDTLDDTAAAAGTQNVLIGGTKSGTIQVGVDTFKVGDGDDYIVAGSGDALIEGSTSNSAIGSGNDTIVLGEANAPWQGGNDTVYGGSGNDVYYLGANSSFTNIHLGSGHSTINLVESPTDISAFALDATSLIAGQSSGAPLAEAVYEDHTHQKLIISTLNPDGSKKLEIFELPPLIANPSSQSTQSPSSAHSLAMSEAVDAASADTQASSSSGGEIIIDGYTGSNLSGVTLNDASAPAVGTDNLSQLNTQGLVGNTDIAGDANYVYTNDVAGAALSSIYGSDSSGSSYGNLISGEGNATYIYAGNGTNTALLGDFNHKATDPLASPQSAMIQGGTGNQSLIGVGNGTETIVGGAVGADTTAETYIDGGGADALLVAGGQNSVIFGGTGADTLIASSSAGSSSSGFNPNTLEIAGVSFWGNAYSTEQDENNKPFQQTALPKTTWVETSSSDVQVNLSLYQSDGTFATPFGLLGSSLDSGVADGTTTLPGSLLVGGTGDDWLIGNAGDDTINGGDPTDTVAGSPDEVLVGGAGADLIYVGGGTELVYADMTPGAAANWADLDASDADTIYGGSGTDYIYGSGGDDVIYGGSGTSIIYTGNGNIFVDAGSGVATVNGGTGNDTIVADGTAATIQTGDGNTYVQVEDGNSTITTGAGNDTVQITGGNALVTEGSGSTTIIADSDSSSVTVQGSSSTTLQFENGSTEYSLIARDLNGDLVLSDEGTDTAITISGYFSNGGNVSLQFGDGTTLGAAQILQASMQPSSDGGSDTLVGSNGNDSIAAGDGNTLIVGVSGNNTLTGGAGDDTIQGGSGTDIIEGGSGTTLIEGGTGAESYVYNLGDGSDTIIENTSASGIDTFRFGTGIDPSDVTYTYDSTSNILVIGFGALSDAMVTVQGLTATQPGQHQITAFSFADGTTLTQLQVIQKGVSIDGTTGNDSLIGSASPDYFDGMGGNDTEVGGGGNDTFVFNSGYGQLTINESYTSGQQPVLQLGAGITASVLKVSSDGTNLILTDGVSGDQVTLDGMWTSNSEGVVAVQFADGTSLTAAQLIQMEMVGTTGNDTIYGTSGAEVLDGKGGNDSVNGDGGSDTFVFNAGYGQLAISESYTSGQQPVLQLGTGITASLLRVTSDGTSIILTDGTSGDRIELLNEEVTADTGVAEVQLADGTTYTAAQLIQLSHDINGTIGSDTLNGTAGADSIDGHGGDDSVIGNGGSDTFVYDAGYGNLTINEVFSSDQQPVLQLGAGITASMLHATTNGQDILLTEGTTGDEIDLQQMWANNGASSGSGIEAVQLADGTTITRSQLIQMAAVTQGTTGNDTLYGTSSAELFDGKGGNDLANGGGGNDTFVFNAGYGQLEINETNPSAPSEEPGTFANGVLPILELGPGITAADLQVTLAGHSLSITDGISGDQITLDGEAIYGGAGVAEVQLADGTILTSAQLLQMAHTITGTTGNDTLYVGDGDIVDGKGGDDYFFSSGGNDTFVFKPGYGQLTINQFGTQYGVTTASASTDYPVVQLGAGITASMLHVTVTPGYNESSNGYGDGIAAPADIVIADGISGDQITLDNMWSFGDTTLPLLQFSDGTSLTVAQLEQMELASGTTGNDTLYGTSGADLIDGKGGNDSVFGSGISDDGGNTYQLYNGEQVDDGNDTFVFNAGYGSLGITEQYSTSQPILRLGTGITTSSLHVTSDGYSLYLTDGITGDQVKLWNMFTGATGWGSTWGVAEVQLANGTVLTRGQLMQMETTGTTGNDTLYGTTGADLFDGKGGNDVEIGDGGSDTFVFNAGYGQLSINESYSNGQQPVLLLGSGISASALNVTTDGTNLTLTDGVSGDQITLGGMWASSNKGVAIVQFADGTSLTAEQLIQKGLTGTTGNDTLIGTPGADLIDGKGGNDYINGEGGNDTFVFNAGYGKLSIYDVQSIIGSSPNQAVLELGPGISASSLHVTENDQHDLILTDGVSGDQISILSPFGRGYPSSTAWGANIQFSDGSTLDMSQLQQMASNLNGTTGSDYLVGTAGDDLIDGKGGNDYEIGNGGSDTFVFNQGYGALEVGTAYGYTLQLGPGITASNLQVFESQSGDGDDLMLTDGTAGDVIRLDGIYENNSSGSVRFSDGTSVALSQLVSEVRYFYTGVDTYRVGAGSGNQWLAYSSEESHVDIFYVDGLTSDDVTVRGNSAGYLTLTNKSTGSQFVLSGYFNGPQNVSIHFSDGATWGGSQIIQAMETGGSGNDTLTGTGAAERFDGKGGNDFVNGGGGSDTFVFNSGYGHLEIDEAYANGQQPILQLGTGITASTLQVTASGGNLLLTDGVTGDQITLDGQNASGNNGVALVQFADGTSLTAEQLIEISQEVGGTVGNDTLTGTSGADWIDGKGGNDFVIGNGGSDTIVFNSGYGDLEINESYAQGQQPVLRLGAGLTAAALEVTADGANLVLTDGVSGDRITLDGQNSSSSDGVALVQFADGTSLTAAQLIQLSKEIQGTTGNDTLTGTSGADLIDGKGGHDSVIGNGGSDTFVYNSGYGDLEINEVYTSGQQPVLQLGAGITASTLQVAMIGANAVLTDGVSGDQITLDNQATSSNDGVALIQFADGTSWTSAQLNAMSHVFVGTTNNDLLTGNSGDDLFDGLGGNDTVVGNGGNDTFVFNVGYGHLDINENFSSGETPVLRLGAGITAAGLKVTPNASGSGLVLTDGTSGDQITLENAAFDDSSYGVQEVQFADGTTLTEAQLIQRETSLPGNGGSITGGAGNDTLMADTANESLIGGTGNEVFNFNIGFGQDTLVANGTATSNTILFGAGIAVSNLTFSTDGSELVIATSNSTGADGKASSITLPGHFVNGSPITDVGELLFSDGSSLSMDQINQLFASSTPPPPPPTTVLTAGADNTLVSDNGVDLLQANGGNDTLTGGSGTDTLESGVGNTVMNGGSGTETFLFNTGFGQDTLVANGSATSNTIQFGTGITASDLSFSTDGSELDITDTNSNGSDGQASSITLQGHFVNGSPITDVGKLLFSNGSYVTMDQINQLFTSSTPPSGPTPSTVLTAGSDNTLVSDNGVDLLKANDGNDTLTGGSGTDTLESGVGNTVMNGGSGAETYLFNTGFGQDTVEANGSASSNTIQFGAGITVSDLNFMTDGSELLIQATNSNGSDGQASSITLPDHWVDGTPATDVGKLVFNDGSYVTMDQINQLFGSRNSTEAASTAAAPMAAMVRSSDGISSTAAIESTAEAGGLSAGSPMWSQSVKGSELARQVNLLTHAISSYTGGDLSSDTSMPVTPAAPGDLMLHAAA